MGSNGKKMLPKNLIDHVETEDELNELMEYIRKENIGEICKDIFEGAAENLTNEKFYENGELDDLMSYTKTLPSVCTAKKVIIN